MAVSVSIKGKQMTIVIDMQDPTPSASGKTLVVASTYGNISTNAQVNGKPITLGLNAYIKP